MKKENDNRSWWDGNQTRVWRIFVLMFIAILSFLSTWIFNGVDSNKSTIAGLSDKYVTKTDFQCFTERIEQTLNNRFNSIDYKLNNADRKVEDINKYLRDLNR